MGWVDDIIGSAAVVSILYLVRCLVILVVHFVLTRFEGDAGTACGAYDGVDALAESFVDGILLSDVLQDKKLLRARQRRGALLCTGLSGLAFAAVIALEVGFVFLDSGRTRDAVRTSRPLKLDLMPRSVLVAGKLSTGSKQVPGFCMSLNASSPYSAFDVGVKYNTLCAERRTHFSPGRTASELALQESRNIAVLAASSGPGGKGPRVVLVIPKQPGEALRPSVDDYLQDDAVSVITFRALLETLDSRKLVSYVVLPSLASQSGAAYARTVLQGVMKTAESELANRHAGGAGGNYSCRPVPASFASGEEQAPSIFGAFEFQCDPAFAVTQFATAVQLAFLYHVGLFESKLELEDGNELTAVFARSVVRGIPFRVSVALIAVALFLLLAKFVGGRKQLSLDRCAVLVAAGGANVPPDASQDWKSTHTAVCAI
jgi:hypothetical protein